MCVCFSMKIYFLFLSCIILLCRLLKCFDEAVPMSTLNMTFACKINKMVERKIVNIFLPISFNICFGCLKEPSH